MQRIIYLILVLFGSAGLSFTQAQPVPGQGRQFDPSQLVKAEKQLLLDSVTGLNDDQKLIIEAIYEDYLVSFTQARENMDPDNRGAMRENMQRIRQAKDEALRDILTTEQYNSFEAILARRREAMQQRRRNRNE